MEEVHALYPLFRSCERVLQTIRLKASLSAPAEVPRRLCDVQSLDRWRRWDLSVCHCSQAVPSEREVTSDNK